MSVHSNGGFPSEVASVHDESVLDELAASEGRWELVREAQWSLREWERHRRPEDRARLVATLEQLAALMRATG